MMAKPIRGNIFVVILIVISFVVLIGFILFELVYSKATSDSKIQSFAGVEDKVAKTVSDETYDINYTQAPSVLNKTAVVLFNFSNDNSQPFKKNEVEEVVFSKTNSKSVYRYFQESSYNEFSVEGEVFGWYTIPVTNENCDLVGWKNAADEMLKGNGVDLGSIKHFVYIHPKTSCNWGGVATTLGTIPSTSYINGVLDGYTIIHELAHNLGLGHAGFIDCTYNDPPRSIGDYNECSLSTGGDPFDPLGHTSNLNHLNAAHKVFIGWVPESNIKTVESDGIFTIAPIEIKTNDLQVLKIKKADTNDYYYLEYRQPIGLDKNFPERLSFGTNITIFHLAPNQYDFTDTYFLDTTPQTPHDFYDGPLKDGAAFYDQANRIMIMQLSHDNNSAKISVKFSKI